MSEKNNYCQQNVYASLGCCVGVKFCFLNFVQQRGTMKASKTQAVININVSANCFK
jgi:hypothetical protein